MKNIKTIKSTVFQFVCMIVVFVLFPITVHAASIGFPVQQTNEAKALSHYMLGVMYDLTGMNAFAVHEYEQAVHHQGDVALSRLRLGSSYARIGRLEDADIQLSKAAELNPGDLQARYLLALIYSTQRKFDQAAGEYEEILKSFSENDPSNIEIYIYLGQLYYSQRQFDKASKQFKQILELDPENTEIMYLLSSLYLENDRREEAIDILKQCVSLEPKNAGCFNSLAYVYAEDNVFLDVAYEHVQEALKQEPNNGAYLDTLAWVYYRQGKYVEALKHLDAANAVIQDYIVYDHMGDVYYAMNRHEEARKHWRKALEMMPDDKSILKKINQLENPSVKKDQ